ncbi:hypothetical protein [Nocardia huaxiensis]|uniref:hypothetical protein n=1 Tax=Nocardia huaxiensis TaxID=2755382 RepID=UPI001E322259|nr:hypothetical protein [Nocardia huaxiensis]UFS98226.1 hypothetical protein LPY97_10180 [Nocardia huaxiensis]
MTKKRLLGALVVGVGLTAATVGSATPASAWPDAPHIGDACHDPGARDEDPWGTSIVCVDPDPNDHSADLFWAHG